MMQVKDRALLREACYVGGAWVGKGVGKGIPVANPATGEVLGTVPSLGAEAVREAIEAARSAWADWRREHGQKKP